MFNNFKDLSIFSSHNNKLNKVEIFVYLQLAVQENGGIVKDVVSRIKCDEKQQECCCDTKVSLKVKGSYIKPLCKANNNVWI